MDIGPLARLKELTLDPSTMSAIAQRMADGETLKAIATAWEVPYGRLLEWIVEDEARAGKYRRAKAFGAIHEVDEAKEIADGATPESIAVDKERIRIRQFRASRLSDEYREKQEVNVQVKQDLSLTDREQRVLEVARTVEWLGAVDGDIKRRRAEQGLLEAPRVEKVVTPEKEERDDRTDTSDI